MEKEAVAKIVGIMMMSRNFAHLAHLKSKGPGSYAEHSALGGFYDSIVGMADGLAEATQGKYGLLDIEIPAIKGDIDMPAEALRTHVTMIENACKKCDTSWIDSIVQEVEACYYATIYKLENLA